MTPAARCSAAIAILDRVLAGQPAEQALTNWGRASRFAGAGDRFAVRDLVFAAIRCQRSCAALGGALSGRGLILGSLRAQGIDPETLFTGDGHAPACLNDDERHVSPATDPAVLLDCPDWLMPQLCTALGDDFTPVMQALQKRAPLFLRVNLRKTTLAGAIESLAAEGIVAVPHSLAATALEVTENPRKVAVSAAYAQGLVELQDAASQAVVQALPLRDGMRVLDFCAGGGGKTLAMAGAARIKVYAHDSDANRMRDLPARATRAGVKVHLLPPDQLQGLGLCDLVLIDAPCSGSGSWRRSPEGKWALTPSRLDDLLALQAHILTMATNHVAPKGVLAYATCSLLDCENAQQIQQFLQRHTGWVLLKDRQLTPLDGGDGFYYAILTRNN